MTTVVQAAIQPVGYPPQQGHPQQQGYPQQGHPQQQPQATIIQAPPTTYSSGSIPGKNERYNKKAGLVTGVLQIIAGGYHVLFGIVALNLGSLFSLSWSIWGGTCSYDFVHEGALTLFVRAGKPQPILLPGLFIAEFYVVTGILGVVSKNQSKCVIIAYMVMNIISAVCAGSQMIYDAVAAAGISRWLGWLAYDYNIYYGHTYQDTCVKLSAIIAMHSLSALVELGEMIIAIVASAYCCAGCCGTTASTQQSTIVTYAQPAPNPQMTVVSPGGSPPATTYPQVSSGAYPQASGGAYPQVPPAQPPTYTQQQPTYEEVGHVDKTLEPDKKVLLCFKIATL